MIPIIPIASANGAKPANLEGMLVEDHERGDYRLHRSAFTDPALF